MEAVVGQNRRLAPMPLLTSIAIPEPFDQQVKISSPPIFLAFF
jgi:hypothetical protein